MFKKFCIIFISALSSITLYANTLDDLSEAPVEEAIQATRLDHSKFTAPVAVSVITQREISERGYLTLHDLFRDVPGFRVTVLGTEKRLSYHGTAVRQNRRLRVTVDGVNVLIGDGAYVEFNRLPITLDDIARVTIVRGTNGASYGDNAFLASIDFQLKDADDGRGSGLLLGYGQDDRFNISGFYSIATPTSAAVVNANTYGIREFDFSNPADVSSDAQISRFNLSFTGQKDANPLTFSVQGYDAEHNVDPYFGSLVGEQINRGYSLSLTQKNNLSESQHIDWVVSHSNQQERITSFECLSDALEAFVSNVVPEQSEELLLRATALSTILQRPFEELCGSLDAAIKSRRTDAELEYNQIAQPFKLAVGGSATYIDAQSEQYIANRESQENLRLFGELAYAYGDVTLHLGTMTQYANNVDDVQFAGRTAINWQFSERQAWRLSVADSFRIPSLVESAASWSLQIELLDVSVPEFDGSIDVAGRSNTERNNVRSERIRSYELGYYVSHPRHGLTIDGKVFYERVRRPIEYTTIFFAELPANKRPYSLSGAEVEFELRPAQRIKINGTYSYLDTTARSSFERGLYGRHAGSLAAHLALRNNDGISFGYYGNSSIGGIDYGRFDLVYNWRANVGTTSLDAKAVVQYYTNKSQGSEVDVFGDQNLKLIDHATQCYLQLALRW